MLTSPGSRALLCAASALLVVSEARAAPGDAAPKAGEHGAPSKPLGANASATGSNYGPAISPFSFGDLSWLPGNHAPPDSPLAWGPFKGELRVDVAYNYSLANPVDNTITGSSEVFRHNEFQVTMLGFGGDFYYKGAHARLMAQFGLYSQGTPRNDGSAARGQWQLEDAYRYLSEAYAGYHVNVLAGLNIQAGLFLSYIGLWSYYNFDNWTYQPSFVSFNTAWYFNGLRVQLFPTERLKVELWVVNGWQAYGKFNTAPGVGLQIRWSPTDWFTVVTNHYFGTDTLGVPSRKRVHTDNSAMARVYNRPGADGVTRVALSLTLDAGCEFGEGNGVLPAVGCSNQYFAGLMAYVRMWLYRDLFAVTGGGGAVTNPGRYLVLLPPINGATAISGTPYFTTNPGDPFSAWDVQGTVDFMPLRYLTVRGEFTHRASNVPYWAGHGGVTPPNGQGSFVNQGPPGSRVPGFSPDLVTSEDRFTVALMLRL